MSDNWYRDAYLRLIGGVQTAHEHLRRQKMFEAADIVRDVLNGQNAPTLQQAWREVAEQEFNAFLRRLEAERRARAEAQRPDLGADTADNGQQ